VFNVVSFASNSQSVLQSRNYDDLLTLINNRAVCDPRLEYLGPFAKALHLLGHTVYYLRIDDIVHYGCRMGPHDPSVFYYHMAPKLTVNGSFLRTSSYCQCLFCDSSPFPLLRLGSEYGTQSDDVWNDVYQGVAAFEGQDGHADLIFFVS
jgi:hypothetical protein